MKEKSISNYAMERSLGIANGYIKKQTKRGNGSIGSFILEKIMDRYLDLNIEWLISGKGLMIKTTEEKERGNLLQFAKQIVERLESNERTSEIL